MPEYDFLKDAGGALHNADQKSGVPMQGV